MYSHEISYHSCDFCNGYFEHAVCIKGAAICEYCATKCCKVLAQHKANTLSQCKTATEEKATEEAAAQTKANVPAAGVKLTRYQNEAITDALCRFSERADPTYKLELFGRSLIDACLEISDKTSHSLSTNPYNP